MKQRSYVNALIGDGVPLLLASAPTTTAGSSPFWCTTGQPSAAPCWGWRGMYGWLAPLRGGQRWAWWASGITGFIGMTADQLRAINPPPHCPRPHRLRVVPS